MGELVGTLAIPAASTKNSAAATAAVNMIFFMAISHSKRSRACGFTRKPTRRCDGHHMRLRRCEFSHTWRGRFSSHGVTFRTAGRGSIFASAEILEEGHDLLQRRSGLGVGRVKTPKKRFASEFQTGCRKMLPILRAWQFQSRNLTRTYTLIKDPLSSLQGRNRSPSTEDTQLRRGSRNKRRISATTLIK